MSAPFTQSGCPLELSLTATISTCMWKETWIDPKLTELYVLKVGKNREISRFLRFSLFLTNFEFVYYGQHFEIQY